MMTKSRGISTFIATLLLMVLAVSAGVVIYAYTMGYLGGYGGTDTLGAMSLDQATMDSDTGEASVHIRNIGKSTIVIDTVYVEGIDCEFSAEDPLNEGEVIEIIIDEPSADAWDSGKTHDIKIIAEDNTQLSFTIKAH